MQENNPLSETDNQIPENSQEPVVAQSTVLQDSPSQNDSGPQPQATEVFTQIQPISQPPQTNQQPNLVLNEKPKPPVAAQILYALAFIGLVFGLLASLILLVGFGSAGGVLGSAGLLISILLAVITVAGFFLIHEIRQGRKWALITYTVLLSLSTVSTLVGIVSGSQPNRSSVIGFMVVWPLIIVLWTKNKSYFDKI